MKKRFSCAAAARRICRLALLAALLPATACVKQTPPPQMHQMRRMQAEDAVTQAMSAYARGDCRESIRLFSSVPDSQTHPVALNGLGMAQLLCNQPQQAIASFRKAVSLSPTSAALHANLGSAYFAAREYARAANEFETALRSDPANPEALVGKAGVLLEQDRPDEALRFLQMVDDRDKDAPAVLFNRALVLYRLNLFGDAERIMSEYLNKVTDDPDAYNACGVILLRLGRHEEARAALDTAVRLRPDDAVYYYNRGNVCRADRKFRDAVEDYSRAIACRPDFAEAFVNRGDMRFLLKDAKQGCADLERACALGLCERLESYQELGRCATGVWK